MAPEKLVWGALALLPIPAFVMPSETPDWPAWIVGARLAGDASRLYSFEESPRAASPPDPRAYFASITRPARGSGTATPKCTRATPASAAR